MRAPKHSPGGAQARPPVALAQELDDLFLEGELASDAPLLAKYTALARKYRGVVQKLHGEGKTRHRLSDFGLWAFSSRVNGLALLHGDVVESKNRRWFQLDGVDPAGSGWRILGAAGANETFLHLSEIATREAALAIESGALRQVRCQRSGQIVELQVERLEGGRADTAMVLALDITDRLLAEEQVLRARLLVEEHERMRAVDRLASGVVHDLKTTLRAMLLHVELLRGDAACMTAQRPSIESLDRIVRGASEQLEQAMGRVRDVARERDGAPTEPLLLREIVEQAAQLVRGDAGGKRAAMKVEISLARLPRIRANPGDLRRVFVNLLENARAAMPRGGTVRVVGRREAGAVRVDVSDEGRGILAENLERVFEPMFTASESGGTGLGLAIVRAVMERLDGSVTAANGPEGGAVFTLVFPATVVEPERAEKGAVPRPRTRRSGPPARRSTAKH